MSHNGVCVGEAVGVGKKGNRAKTAAERRDCYHGSWFHYGGEYVGFGHSRVKAVWWLT